MWRSLSKQGIGELLASPRATADDAVQFRPHHNISNTLLTRCDNASLLKRDREFAGLRILAPDGDFLILTSFDPDKPEQRERAFSLVPRFMAWKLATGFVMTAETWLGPERTRSGEEAVLTVGVSYHERMAVIRPIRRTPGISFVPPEWLPADALDEAYFRLLPSGQTTVTAEEAAMLVAVFAEDG